MALDVQMPVLVVDDYKTMIRIIRNLLKQLGFEDIDDAADGTEALEKMKRGRVHQHSPYKSLVRGGITDSKRPMLGPKRLPVRKKNL